MTRLRMFDGLSGLRTRFGKTKPVVRPARNSFRRAATSGEMSTKRTEFAVFSSVVRCLPFACWMIADRREIVQQVLDFKAEELTDAAACGGREDHEHPVLRTLDPGIRCRSFRCDRWSPLLRGFHERKVQFL